MALDTALRDTAARLIAEVARPELHRQLARRDLGFPLFSEAGRWRANPEERWSDGFWPGLYWLAAGATGDAELAAAAAEQAASLPPRIDDPGANYDLGFLFHPSHALGHRLTGEARYRETALSAARRLCDFLCKPAGVITVTYPERAALHGRPVVTSKIDVMMNLTLLWWAWRESGEDRFGAVALSHAGRSLDHLLRPDGAAWELADFDPESGAALFCGTREGVVGPSCWARGQAWAVYGFLQAAHFSGEARFLEAARRAYGFWRAQLPAACMSCGLPYWDLLAAGDARDRRDSSAAAIVLAALARARAWGLDLGHDSREVERALGALAGALNTPEQHGLLGRGCAYRRKGEGLEGATVWGDYYLLEALCGLAQAGPRA